MFWLGLIIGSVVGSIIGFITLALCAAAGRE